MKKAINYLIVCLFLFSCKKDNSLTMSNKPGANVKTFPVTFNVADFTPQVVGSSKGTSVSEVPLTGHVGFFTYIAYDSEGNEVSRIKQDSAGRTLRYGEALNQGELYQGYPINAPSFGCINDTLVAGQYTIVMIASQTDYSINNRNEGVFEYSFAPLSEALFYYNRGLDSWSRAEDTFFKKFNVTIKEPDSQHQATLDRIVGKAEINVLDSRPGTIFKFLFVNENEAFKFSDEQPFGNTFDIDLEDNLPAIEGKTNLSYSKFILNTIAPVDVIIKVYENGALSATKTVEGVRFYKNKRTILTGNIYSGSASSTGFSVKVNDQFDADSVNVSF
jgi:hypothetical protein